MSDKIADRLRAAADLLERDGHCKLRLHDPRTNSHCAGGAIMRIDSPEMYQTRVSAETANAVARYLDLEEAERGDDQIRWSMMVNWNNAPERTAEEVVDVFRTVANLCQPAPASAREETVPA